MIPTNGDDILIGTAGGETIDGLLGNDTITGLGGDDTLIGNGGDDILDGGRGNDTVRGEGGNDLIIVDFSANSNGLGIGTGGFATDPNGGHQGNYATSGFGSVAFTGVERFNVIGTGFLDIVITGDGNDTVSIGAGNDTVTLGRGTDSADGGTGIDGLGKDFSLYASGVAIDQIANTSMAAGGSFLNFEYFSGVIGTAFDDSFLGTTAANNDTVSGGGGNDTASFYRGDDMFNGGTGADHLIVDYSNNANGLGIGTGGFDTDPNGGHQGNYAISGFGSVSFTGIERFTVTGTNFLDIVTTGDGNDAVSVGGGNDTVTLGRGTDTADGGTGIDGLGKDFSLYASGVAIDQIANTSVSAGGSFLNFEYFSGVIGTTFDDSFLGTTAANNDTVSGGGGNDTASFYRGNDTFNGGTGADHLIIDYSTNANGLGIGTSGFAVDAAGGFQGNYGTSGFGSLAFTGIERFTVTGTDFVDVIITGSGNDIVNLGVGNDMVTLGLGTDSADGGAGTDGLGKDFSAYASGVTINQTANTSVAAGGLFLNFEYFSGVIGTAFDDNFLGTTAASNDIVSGGGGNDTASFYRGNDTFNGGTGADHLIIDYSTNANGLGIGTSGFAVDAAGGFQGNYGTSGWGSVAFTGIERFTVTGTSFTDNITTGSGNDTLDGGAGTNQLTGGAGNDTYIVSVATNTITELTGEGTDEVRSSFGVFTLANNLESLRYTGGATFTGNGNAANNQIFGGALGDLLSGLDGNDTIFGNAGDDVISGGNGNDVIIGGLGNDMIDGGGGPNELIGGAGDDLYTVSAMGDSIVELVGEGIDEVRTSVTAGTLSANVENLRYTGVLSFVGNGNAIDNMIFGGVASDQLSGFTGNDILTGGTGSANTLIGGLGNDVYVVGVLGDSTLESVDQGIDVVLTSFNVYGLQANIENLTYTDNAAHGAGVGNILDNVITGGTGIDSLFGRAGNDTLRGGAGAANTLVGQEGDDIYVVDAAGDSVIETVNQGIDTVQTSRASFALRTHVENLTYTGISAFTGIGAVDNNRLAGGIADDFLSGLDGNDILIGKSGADTLIGGTGSDQFAYEGGETAFDRIFDFVSGIDKIALRDAGFAQTATIALVQSGAPVATATNSTFLFNVNNGILSFDADGTGAGAAVTLAQLNAGLTLTTGDFLFY